MINKKCIFVIGPESSGSMLIARILAHTLGIIKFGKWSGYGKVEDNTHKIIHRSLPYHLNPPEYPDIEKWIKSRGGCV